MKRLTTTLLFIAMLTFAKGGPIGSWTSYLAYGDITEIVPVDKMVYVLSSKGLFSYNTNEALLTRSAGNFSSAEINRNERSPRCGVATIEVAE